MLLDFGSAAVSLTRVVSAASGRAASDPAALVHRDGPLVDLVVLQGVGREVADLDLCVVLLEVLKGHPGEGGIRVDQVPDGGESGFYGWFGLMDESISESANLSALLIKKS